MNFLTILLFDSAFEVLGAIIGFILVLWFLMYLLALFSKATNTGIRFRRGGTITPETFDEMHAQVKGVGLFAKDIAVKIYSATKKQIEKSKFERLEKLTKLSTKIDQLKELNQLLQDNVITQEEFDIIKKELV